MKLLIVVAGGILVAAAIAAAPVTEQPVRTTKSVELAPVSNGPYLAWAQAKLPLSFEKLAVYARRAGGPAVRVTLRGHSGLAGSIDGRTLALVEYTQGKYIPGKYDLGRFFLYDLRSGKRRWLKVPYRIFILQPPQLSGKYLLYTGFSALASGTWLHSLKTGEERFVGINTVAAQLSGNYGVVTTCADVCSTERYDIAADTLTQASPTDPNSSFVAPSVTPDGTVYAVQIPAIGCGAKSLVRIPLHGPAETVLRFSTRVRIVNTRAVQTGTGTTIYYDRSRCGSNNFDLYKAVIPD